MHRRNMTIKHTPSRPAPLTDARSQRRGESRKANRAAKEKPATTPAVGMLPLDALRPEEIPDSLTAAAEHLRREQGKQP